MREGADLGARGYCRPSSSARGGGLGGDSSSSSSQTGGAEEERGAQIGDVGQLFHGGADGLVPAPLRSVSDEEHGGVKSS